MNNINKQKNILLVEDDPFIIDIYSTKLKEAGFDVQSSTDGEDALKKIKDGNPDLILLDIVLPKLTGLECLKQIKSFPQFKDIPIIILSNLGQKYEVEKGLQMGANKYLIKAHYTPSEIIKEIKQIIPN
ncbi:response regulator [Patescibacteria group bacterium]|nr:response regulator [Patescibacteria group bacterium]MBU1877219.1 response regulator [Patescibacteria group bacterium]